MKLQQLQEAKYVGKRKLSIDDFKRNDKIIITYHSLRGVEKRIGKVRTVDRILGEVSYCQDYSADFEYLSTGQGSFSPQKIGKHRYGIVDVEVI